MGFGFSAPGGAEPDNNSILFNPQGKLEVNKPSQETIGKFNNGLDSWTLTEGSSRTTAEAFEGSHSVQCVFPGGIEQDFNLSGASTVDFYAKGGFRAAVEVDGSTVGTTNSTNQGSWNQYSIDISGFSGVKTLGIIADGGSGELYVDQVEIVRSKVDKVGENVD